ncbi:hypothetical protein [Sphingosinicella rhizophila]|uniref:Uncharacterized protein n=1 Tax=Sphingosinicella rhizophila TaxID=3050082 RepID=A0ABU3QA75_9SPHN|nr:hypothetical protein [Sphingosinicella sp. GR2756]MDT9600034.1 hypothetical protein [Sphingosinicella sp. GR2756]
MMATDTQLPKWRNFMRWSAIGAIIYFVPLAFALMFRDGGALAVFRSTETVAKLILALIFSMFVIGYSMRNALTNARNVRYILMLGALGIVVSLAILWGFDALRDAGAFGVMHVSQAVAAGAGFALLFFAVVGILVISYVRMTGFMDAEDVAELREQGRAQFYSWIGVVAMGMTLILLAMSGPGRMVPPAAALAVALVLIAAATLFGFLQWRLMDELMRRLSLEAGNIAFLLIFLIGGGWAMLAHLHFVARPTPLDWLVMLIGVSFVASIIATIRRGLFADGASRPFK